MDNPIKVKDEPVEEKSPELLKNEEKKPPVREGQGEYSVRDTMKKKEKNSYPLPSNEDKKFKGQDEFDERPENKNNNTDK